MYNFLLEIIQYQVVQIILVAYIGALLGEMKKEIDDEEALQLSRFVITWMGSGFGGVMIGLILQGTVGKDNHYVVLGGSGIAGYAGYKKSLKIATKVIDKLIGDDDDDDDDEDTKKKNNKTKKKKITLVELNIKK